MVETPSVFLFYEIYISLTAGLLDIPEVLSVF